MWQDGGVQTASEPVRRPGRPRTLAGRDARSLEAMFMGASAPGPRLDGRLRGALLATTLGPGLDALARGIARLWLPWLGKRFDLASETGWNVFEKSAGRVQGLVPARYGHREPEDESSFLALPFRSSLGPSALGGPEVLRIDYDDPGNLPGVRRVLDELVEVRPGVYLGQALLRVGRRPRRVAWFALEP